MTVKLESHDFATEPFKTITRILGSIADLIDYELVSRGLERSNKGRKFGHIESSKQQQKN